MSEYTPSTGEIRELVAVGADNPSYGLEAFDRWIAAHDAEVRKQRVVSTVEELEALPVGSVVRDVNGDVFERDETVLHKPGVLMTGEPSIYSLNWVTYPANILFEPTEEETKE